MTPTPRLEPIATRLRTVRPAEILTHALGLDPETVRRAGMVKTETILADKRDEGRKEESTV